MLVPMEIALISEADVLRHANRSLAKDAIRDALIAVAGEGSELFPVSIGSGAPADSMVAVKSGFLAGLDMVGVKVGTYWPDNGALGLPNHGSTTLLLEPASGLPRALVNAGALNGLRTAAANAVATEALARADATTLLIVGTGHQAEYELRALLDVRPFERVQVWGRSPDKAADFVERASELQVDVSVAADLKAAAHSSAVITTVTTSTAALLQAAWIQPGTHISAMGADKHGKQELAPNLLSLAELFADHPAQSIQIGEFQHAANREVSALGHVLTGQHPGRISGDSITIFDSSGIALQDIAIANRIYEALDAAGELKRVSF
ncbi:MAG: ornithine cyclodeaminase [Bacteroidia bacterium]|jgi:ornithine cyclodeaminase